MRILAESDALSHTPARRRLDQRLHEPSLRNRTREELQLSGRCQCPSDFAGILDRSCQQVTCKIALVSSASRLNSSIAEQSEE
jgi:hypothetical protein